MSGTRKIIQISTASPGDGQPIEVFALADDGTVWKWLGYGIGQWFQFDICDITGIPRPPGSQS
jgi:hypothetical protein